MRGSILVGDNPKVLVEIRTCSENAVGFRSTMITFHGMSVCSALMPDWA